MQKAQEAMTRHLVSLTPEHRIYHAMETMERFRIRHIPIFGDAGWVGIISDRDLKRHVSARFQTQDETVEDRVAMTRQLNEIMSTELIYVTPEDDLEDVMDLMTQHQISSVLVRDESSGDVLGIITQTDLMRYLRQVVQETRSKDQQIEVDWLVN